MAFDCSGTQVKKGDTIVNRRGVVAKVTGTAKKRIHCVTESNKRFAMDKKTIISAGWEYREVASA